MVIKKSKGTTPTERLLAGICENTFLKLWSYPNPFKDDRKELCDLLAVFQNHVFIFVDRECAALNREENDSAVNWNRWKKEVIEKQVRSAKKAESYIRSGRDIFIDKKSTVPFPINIDRKKMIIHKLIVAHGAKEACKQSAVENVSGSLAILYGKNPPEPFFPFCICLRKRGLTNTTRCFIFKNSQKNHEFNGLEVPFSSRKQTFKE